MAGKGDVLVVEDTYTSLRLLTEMLTAEGYSVRPADSGALALATAAARTPELILLDIRMPGMDGFEVFKRLKAGPGSKSVPVIFLSASVDATERLEGLKLGAVDFIAKPFKREELLAKVRTHMELSLLRARLEALVAERTRELEKELGEHKLAAEALRESEEQLKTMFNEAPLGIALIDSVNGRIYKANPMFARIMGRTMQEMADIKWIDIAHPEDLRAYLENMARLASGEISGFGMETRYIQPGGRAVWVNMSVAPMKATDKMNPRHLCMVEDISERKAGALEKARLEEQLSHSQKMEAVGRLAGGVAHDFNNILTAIQGYGGFLLKGLPPQDPKRSDTEEILKAADRAASLTRQLLAFSRRQIMSPRVVDINRVVGAMSKMLRRLIGENLAFTSELAAEACTAKVDPGQMEQVVMNLVVNARDAIAGTGTITLATEVLPPGKPLAAYPDFPKGPVVCLRVRDTGSGLTEEIKSHLFEPFYTTKEKGKGTGLGLSTIFGIVKQSGGEVEVESSPGGGTTFSVYLPYVEPDAQDKDKESEKDILVRGTETILLVEDDESLLRLGERILRTNGYTVLTAPDGNEALKVAERHGRRLDLVLTDVVMPGMSGRELARELVRRNMADRILYMSGYTDNAIVKHGVLDPGLSFLYKPFTNEALALKLREVLDGPASQAQA